MVDSVLLCAFIVALAAYLQPMQESCASRAENAQSGQCILFHNIYIVFVNIGQLMLAERYRYRRKCSRK